MIKIKKGGDDMSFESKGLMQVMLYHESEVQRLYSLSILITGVFSGV